MNKTLVRYLTETDLRIPPGRETEDASREPCTCGGHNPRGIHHEAGALESLEQAGRSAGEALSDSDLGSVLDLLFDLLAGVIPFHRICLAKIVDDGRAVTLDWCRSLLPMRLQASHRTELTGTVLPHILERRTPGIIDDLEAYFHAHSECETTRLLVAEGIRASLVCPLLVKGAPIGLLFFSSITRGVYTAEHARLGRRIANLVAPVVERERLTQTLSQREAWIRRNQVELQKTRRELNRFFDLSMDLFCVAGMDGYFKVINPSFERVLGYASEDLLASPFVDFVHPEDLASTIREVERLGQGKETVAFENRYRCKDGSYRWLQWNAVSIPEEGALYAVARDVTSTKELDGRMRAIVENSPTAMVLTDHQDRIVLANEHMGAMFQYSTEELAGQPTHILVPEKYRAEYAKVRARLWEDRKRRALGSSGSLFGLRQDGSEVPIEIATTSIELGETYLLSTVTDITERQKSIERVRTIVESSPDGILLVGSDGNIALTNSATERIFGYTRTELLGSPLEVLLPPRFQGTHAQHRSHFMHTGAERRMGVAPYSLFGLHKNGREIPLDIALKPIDMQGDQFVITTVRDLTESKRLEREFSVAREVQRSLLPKEIPTLPGFAIAADSRPAEATCGDFLNFTPLSDGRLVLAVGDVSGHGLGPAILTASVMSYLRAFARAEDRLQEILRKTNLLLFEETRDEDFATAFVARIDPRERTLRYANAGHPEGYVFDRSGNLRERLAGTGFPLGMFAEARAWEMNTVTLDPGDVVVLITDGIYEATSPDDDMFGDERILAAARSGLAGGPPAILDSIYEAVAGFTDSKNRDDDMTVMVIQAQVE